MAKACPTHGQAREMWRGLTAMYTLGEQVSRGHIPQTSRTPEWDNAYWSWLIAASSIAPLDRRRLAKLLKRTDAIWTKARTILARHGAGGC